jgi:hypothetical protein
MVVQGIIADPEFIFRFEQSSPTGGRNHRITDLELASRLSYFLWSTAPDDELIALASKGRLKDPAVYEQQVRRMLASPKAETLATNFAYQWLHLQNLQDVQPDVYRYPNFDRNLANSMRRETELLFDSIRTENRSVLDLLTSDYTFVDERLATHYGIPNIVGNRFREIKITDPNRLGLLGQASILTLTSLANRTSPVYRGKWVMDVLLGTPPPTPPPNVPALKEEADGGKVLSVRERMQEHRANAVCASCHKMMDPIGFALENFDATGSWRTRDSGFVIDPSGQMFDGSRLDGPVSLREAMLKHSDAYIRTFTENLLMYAAGRVLDYSDMPAVRAVDREAEKDHYRFGTLVLAVTKSPAFQMRSDGEGVQASKPQTKEVAGVRPPIHPGRTTLAKTEPDNAR